LLFVYQAWDLLEGEPLFDVYDKESVEMNDAHHLAAMTALLGPPPREFLERSVETKKYWDEDGKLQDGPWRPLSLISLPAAHPPPCPT
jgi:hypothetical protein